MNPLGIIYLIVSGIMTCTRVPIEVEARSILTVKENALGFCGHSHEAIYEGALGHWCCKCPPGHFKRADCSYGEPGSTDCQPCPFDPDNIANQTYSASLNNLTACTKVLPEFSCKYMNTEYVTGNTTMNARCDCKEGHHVSGEGIEYGCHKHSECIPGHQPYTLGTKTSDTLCERCPEGTYSNISSATESCVPFTKCSSDEAEEKGNITTDTLCVPKYFTSTSRSASGITKTTDQGINGTLALVQQGTRAPLSKVATVIIAIAVAAVMLLLAVILAVACIIARRTKKGDKQQETDCHRRSNKDDGDIGTYTGKDHATTHHTEDEHLLAGSHNSLVSNQGMRKTKYNGTLKRQSSRVECQTVECQTVECAIRHTAEMPNADDKANLECEGKHQTKNCMKVHYEDCFTKLFHKDDLLDAYKKGVENCCLHKALHDHKIGKKMIDCLHKLNHGDVQQFVREFLSETDIDDIRRDFNRSAEIRRQWMNEMQAQVGRNLTPELILGKDCLTNEMKNEMCSRFFQQASKCH